MMLFCSYVKTRVTYQIRNILKASGLFSITINSQRFLPQSLHSKSHFGKTTTFTSNPIPSKNLSITTSYLTLLLIYLRNKVADNSAIIYAHPRTIRIKNPRNSHLRIINPLQHTSNTMFPTSRTQYKKYLDTSTTMIVHC